MNFATNYIMIFFPIVMIGSFLAYAVFFTSIDLYLLLAGGIVLLVGGGIVLTLLIRKARREARQVK